jgi:hypothetical protein
VADWETVSALATAGGTLVLAAATFVAVRSSNRSARIAERALLTGMRPLLVPSLADDPTHKLHWTDEHKAVLSGGRAIAEDEGGVIYLGIGVRNLGAGIALLHSWRPFAERLVRIDPREDLDRFRRLVIDLYVPANGAGYWESAVREQDDPIREPLAKAIRERQPFTIDLLYGDQEGGQRTISRFNMLPTSEGAWYSQASRHWNLDRPDPR